jgi:hypothetical protein
MPSRTEDIEVGKTYIIEHCRKGTFVGKVTQIDKEWIDVIIVRGRPEFLADSNAQKGLIGEKMTLRKNFCSFKETEE